MNRSHAWTLLMGSALANEAELDIACAAHVADEALNQFDQRFRNQRTTVEEFVTRSLTGFINDPADSDHQRGFLSALIQVAEEMNITVLEQLKGQLRNHDESPFYPVLVSTFATNVIPARVDECGLNSNDWDDFVVCLAKEVDRRRLAATGDFYAGAFMEAAARQFNAKPTSTIQELLDFGQRESDALAAPYGEPPTTVERVKHDLNYERISLDTIIEGYIASIS